MKLDKHRERYFADLAVKTTLNKRGRKVYAYVYQGIWYRWGAEGFELKKRRLLYAFLELVNIVAFCFAGFSASALNYQKAVAGCGMLSIVPFLLELWGVFGFCISETYMMETDYKSIDFRLIYGALIRVIILGIGFIIGLISVTLEGKMDTASFVSAAVYMVTLLISGSLARLQHKLEYRNYKSVNGEVGAEC